MYVNKKAAQTNTPIQIQTVSTTNVLGQVKKTYTNTPYISYCNWSDYSGWEREVNNIAGVEENITLYFRWYDPNCKTDGRVIRLTDNAVFEIVSVENIEQRDKAMIVKVRALKGGA